MAFCRDVALPSRRPEEPCPTFPGLHPPPLSGAACFPSLEEACQRGGCSLEGDLVVDAGRWG